MKKIGLTFILFTTLAAFGVQAQGSDTGETWRCFDWRDFGKNNALVELTRARNLTTMEEYFEEMKEGARAAGMEEFLEVLEEIKKPPDTQENRRREESLLESINATRPGQVSVAGVTHKAHFHIEGLNRRWDFGTDLLEDRLEDRLEDLGKGWDLEDFGKVLEDLSKTIYTFSFIIQPDGSGLYFDFSRVGGGEPTGPSQIFKCVLSRRLPQGQSHREKYLQKRLGRERTADGWVYELE